MQENPMEAGALSRTLLVSSMLPRPLAGKKGLTAPTQDPDSLLLAFIGLGTLGLAVLQFMQVVDL